MKLLSESISRKSLVSEKDSITDVIKNIDKSGLGISFVVDSKGNLVGSISDGDIRRAILFHKDLNTKALEIMNKKPIICLETHSKKNIKDLMIKNKVFKLPMLSSQKKFLGIYDFLSDEKENNIKDNFFLIMAGGKGVRLGEITKEIPKPMLPFLGKPMISHILEKAKKEGFRKFIISVNYLKEIVKDYLKDGKELGIEIQYIEESEPLGTAGSISLLDIELEKPLIVSNGDIISELRYSDLLDHHSKNSSSATMTVYNHVYQNSFGVVESDGLNFKNFKEKPVTTSFINAGIYVLDPLSLSYLKKNKFLNMPDLFERLKEDNRKVIIYPLFESWMDVGRPEDILLARKFIKKISDTK
tara:strand:- start:104 stop:1177 length:1074 start_codon:yes stop_codon:yes gene_type:complete